MAPRDRTAFPVMMLLWGMACFASALAAESNTPASLRAAVRDLIARHGDHYPRGRALLERLELPENLSGEAFDSLQREALVANPAVRGQSILFVVRAQYPGDHHNTATMFQTGEINAGKYRGRGWLKTLDPATGTVTTLLDPDANATPRDPDVSYDGQRVVFAMRKGADDDYHIYEIDASGGEARQLTSAKGVFDIDPAYLPNGEIVFTSSREPKYCMCNRHIMGNLFVMAADGANIRQIGKSTLHEGHASITPSGQILYDRWEYVDRNFGDAQGLWVTNPDGTEHALYWGNNTGSPGGVIDARIIPGTEQCLCVFTSCHDLPWGAMAILDRRLALDGPEAVVRIWPAPAIRLVNVKGSFDAFRRVAPKYEDPYPLTETTFLVSRQTGEPRGPMGIFLVDVFGNEILLHVEAPGCFDPMPLGPREEPDPIPERTDLAQETGVFYLQNIYEGQYMQGVEPGSVKALRVVASPEKRSFTGPAWGGQGQHAPGMNWHNFENKIILGTVPVEADGSASVAVPADTFVFFQALDGNGMMVQSMRSGTIIRPGEVQGCIGCHENRNSAPPLGPGPAATLRAPSELKGWYGPARKFSYQKEVQPVFDVNCVSCHDFGKPAGEKLRLCGDRTIAFNASYTDLWGLEYVRCIGGGPAQTQPAKSWGSHPSKLVKVLREGHPEHGGVSLSREELDRIITWVDLNAPYYPYYESAYPGNPCGRSPIDGRQLARLSRLTGAKFVTGHGRGKRSQLSFERPDNSPCLKSLDMGSPEYREALAIIRSGQTKLAAQPRADMEGFVPATADRERLTRYGARAAIEQRNRQAVINGERVYD